MIRMTQKVDCIFDLNGTHTVLVRRGDEAFRGYWALPGGRQRAEENLERTLVREINEGLGLKIKVKNNPDEVEVNERRGLLDQVRTYSTGSDSRAGNTTVYSIQMRCKPEEMRRWIRTGSDVRKAGVFELKDLPELEFNHRQFLKDYYCRFKRYRNPFPTTDLIIEYKHCEKEGIVLITRKNPPYGIALPGGFAEWGISLEDNARKEAREETGLEVILENPGNPYVYSEPSRDPRGHMISNTYYARGHGILRAGDDAISAEIYTIDEVLGLIKKDELAFDHARILRDYLHVRGYKI